MPPSVLIDVEALRVGMFIQLEMGWMNHPFPTSSFRISSPEQIRTLRGLGLRKVRCVPSRSLPVELDAGPGADTEQEVPQETAGSSAADEVPQAGASQQPDEGWAAVHAHCRARYHQAAGLYVELCASVDESPTQARARVEELARLDVAELLDAENYAVHLLAQVTGQHATKHAVNVMVLSMLLGRTLGMGAQELQRLAAAAFLHDIGKIHLPAHIAEPGAPLSPGDRARYEGHVMRSVALAQRMGFGGEVLLAIGQHHEMADGSGFPRRQGVAPMGRHGQILALVNRYDRLCNPLHGEPARTPHEALAQLFAQERHRFDAATVLPAFIRLMGVYPPGSMVQLDDGRFARVVASNSQYPLRPCVLPFEAGMPLGRAPVIDLGGGSERSVRRSVKFDALSDDVLDFFLPQQHLCYFFERVPPADRREVRAP